MNNKILGIEPQIIFLIIGLIYGLGFVFITPPLQVMDEGEHFNKAIYLSEGNIVPETLNNHAVIYIPGSVRDLQSKFDPPLKLTSKEKIKKYIQNSQELFIQPLNPGYTIYTDTISGVAIITYFPIPYFASAFAIMLGAIFNFSPVVLMYLGRLANLLVWIILIYLAIKITPVHKWVLLLLALMPMTIFQGASLSADSFTIAFSFLIIAVFLYYSFDNSKKTINNKDVVLLFVLMLIIGLIKQTYIFLIFLFFLIPSYKFGSIKKMLLIFAIIFISAYEVSLSWNIYIHGFYIPTGPNISVENQMDFILSNPLHFPTAFLNTVFNPNIMYGIIISFVGKLGWEETGLKLPVWFVGAYLALLTLTALVDKSRAIINYKRKIIIFLTYSSIFILISLSMYITGTPAGQNTIFWILGRYLIPIAPLFFLLFYNNKIKFNIRNGFNLIIIGSLIFSLTMTIYLIINNFY